MKLGRQFVKFGLVGVLNTIIHYLAFLLMYRLLNFPMLLASGLGYSAGIVNSYLINRVWTFEIKSNRRPREFLCFVTVNLVSMGVNLGTLKLLVDGDGMQPEFAQVLAIFSSLVVNFAGNKWWTFAQRKLQTE